ncbi:hypothetical protein [Caballeronia sp. SL2Y3]|uniref:hypothetical protein n=1 Tax=Caballeronia sp. SL2Y3 TaxID=2878151 RepID=UPI001FD52264|nr:hypothetical protein [Caballeronia sp. SL2Y3]
MPTKRTAVRHDIGCGSVQVCACGGGAALFWCSRDLIARRFFHAFNELDVRLRLGIEVARSNLGTGPPAQWMQVASRFEVAYETRKPNAPHGHSVRRVVRLFK